MTLDYIFKTAALSLAGGGEDLVFMVSRREIEDAANRSGYFNSDWKSAVELDAARNGLKIEFEAGNAKLTLARPTYTTHPA